MVTPMKVNIDILTMTMENGSIYEFSKGTTQAIYSVRTKEQEKSANPQPTSAQDNQHVATEPKAP
jgi:hypothetical protein